MTIRIDDNGVTRSAFNDTRVAIAESLTTRFPDLRTEEDSVAGRIVSEMTFNVDKDESLVQICLAQFDPYQAVGAQLSRLATIMGDRRRLRTKSTVRVEITTNEHGATIPSTFLVSDARNQYQIDEAVTLDPNATRLLPFSAVEYGAIFADIGEINSISTPVFGVQSVVNPSAVSRGIDRDTDAALRNRLIYSSSFDSATIEGIKKAVGKIEGVTMVEVIENYTNVTDEIGMPPHSVFVVVQNGRDDDISLTVVKAIAGGIGSPTKEDMPSADITTHVVFDQITQKYFQSTWGRFTDFDLTIKIDYDILGIEPPDASSRIAANVKRFLTTFTGNILTASTLSCAITSANPKSTTNIEQILVNDKNLTKKRTYELFKLTSLMINGVEYRDN